MNIGKLSDTELNNAIANHQRLKATGSNTYRALLEEHNRRFGNGLEIRKTIRLIRKRARHRRFLSYGEIADLHGVDWSSVRHQMPRHLWDVICWGNSNGFSMLSAIIVNKQHLDTGRMEPETLKGFVGAARELGYSVTKPERFLAEQQEACFSWARSESSQDDDDTGKGRSSP